MKEKKKIIAVIPAHDEKDHISEVVRKTKKYVNEVIVVDDASNDNTKELAEKEGAIVLRHVINLKKGAALKTGIEAAIMLGADSVVMLDADSQHDPSEIPKLIEKLDKYDLVIGSRSFNEEMPLNSKLGNSILSFLSRLFQGHKIKDTQSGFRAFNTKIYPKIVWKTRDYGVETEMLRNIKKHNLSHSEVTIKTIYDDNYKGTTPLDGAKIALDMIKWRFQD